MHHYRPGYDLFVQIPNVAVLMTDFRCSSALVMGFHLTIWTGSLPQAHPFQWQVSGSDLMFGFRGMSFT